MERKLCTCPQVVVIKGRKGRGICQTCGLPTDTLAYTRRDGTKVYRRRLGA